MSDLQKTFVGLALAAGALLLAGCQSDSVFSQDYPRWIDPAVKVQSANAARHDASLHDCHFEGNALNALGTQKLELMFRGGLKPEAVYLDMPKAAAVTVQARQRAVQGYLAAREGATGQTVNVVIGVNPACASPAAPNLANLGKTDTSESGSASGDSSGGVASKMGSGK